MQGQGLNQQELDEVVSPVFRLCRPNQALEEEGDLNRLVPRQQAAGQDVVAAE